MAHYAVAGALTDAPSFMDKLVTEPALPMQTAAADKSHDALGDLSTSASIAQIVAAVRLQGAASAAVPAQQLMQLGFNSPGFWSAIGAAFGAIAAAVIAQQAKDTHRDFPSLWYVNFPHDLSAADAQAVQRNRQCMTDFRSWSSRKWWEEVGRRYGFADDAVARARQSKEFAAIACEDMVRMSWLRTTRPPNKVVHRIECPWYALHSELVSRVLQGWANADSDVVDTVEPIFSDIVKAAQLGTGESSEMKNVVMEKYVYDRSTRKITSYIRLLSFEMREAFYEVVRGGKNQSREKRVSLELSLCLYEAVFETELWEQFSATLRDDDRDLLWDYVKGQTTDVKNQ